VYTKSLVNEFTISHIIPPSAQFGNAFVPIYGPAIDKYLDTLPVTLHFSTIYLANKPPYDKPITLNVPYRLASFYIVSHAVVP